MSFGISLVTERTHGTLVRLRMAPLTSAQILGGKALSCFTSILFVEVMLLGGRAGASACGRRRMPILALAGLSAAICFVGFMMLVASLGKTEQTASGAAWAILMPLSMIGGAMVPTFVMPAWMQSISFISPIRWTMLAIEGGVWRNFSLARNGDAVRDPDLGRPRLLRDRHARLEGSVDAPVATKPAKTFEVLLSSGYVLNTVRVQAEDRRVGDLHVVRRAGRRQRSHLLQLRPPQSRAVGLRRRRCARSATTSASSLVTGGTIIMYVLSLVLSRDGTQHRPRAQQRRRCRSSAPAAPSPVFGLGWWWTVLTAGWLHGGILHIFFNVLWIRQLGPEIANLYGAGPDGDHLHRRRHRRLRAQQRAGPARRFRSSARGVTVGASASIFGFLGALVHYGRRTGSSHIGQAGPAVRAVHGHHGLHVPRRRQRGAPRRVRRRLSRVDDPRSAEARTHRSHR